MTSEYLSDEIGHVKGDMAVDKNIYQKEMKLLSQKDFCAPVHYSMIHNSQDTKMI